MALSSSTRQAIHKIRQQYKDPITNKPSFATDDAVIEFAIDYLYLNVLGDRQSITQWIDDSVAVNIHRTSAT